jgi:uncharacterized phage-like protein YoqJ
MPGKYNRDHAWQNKVYKLLLEELRIANPDLMISGGALGWDTMFAEAAIELEIPFDLFLPYRDMGDNWPKDSKDKLEYLKSKSKSVIYTSEPYTKNCFFIRDEAMVNDCTEVFSLLNPGAKSGGTFYTVKYAEQKGKKVTNFWITSEPFL